MPDTLPSLSLPSEVAAEARSFRWRGTPLNEGVGLALSGGGFRAMLFHAGALVRMNELGLLARTKRISSVSGGSIAAGILACHWDRFGVADQNGVLPHFAETYLPIVRAFAKQKIDILDIAIGLLPFTSAADHVANSYDEFLFDGKTLRDLPDTPEFVFCATNMSTGVLWRFTKAYAGDYIVGKIADPDFRIAVAVAASSAFPPFLSPLTLDVPARGFEDWPDMDGGRRVDPQPFRDHVMLCDGGVYDNHGLEPIVKSHLTNFASDGGAPFVRLQSMHTDWVSQLRRVLDIEDNQVRALRRIDLMARFDFAADMASNGTIPKAAQEKGARFGTYWNLDGTQDDAVDGALAIPQDDVDRLAQLPTRLSALGKEVSDELINWGYAIADRRIRFRYKGPISLNPAPPIWPLPK